MFGKFLFMIIYVMLYIYLEYVLVLNIFCYNLYVFDNL